ncbi:MAG: hypothetical protein KF869_01015 [Phycisphaeraceae bacterium]|nr:hypothetical protein [Phycisphaeraceae bacterium]
MNARSPWLWAGLVATCAMTLLATTAHAQQARPAAAAEPAADAKPAPRKGGVPGLTGATFNGLNSDPESPRPFPIAPGGFMPRGPHMAANDCIDAPFITEGTHGFDTTGFSPGGPTTTCAGNTSANGWWVYFPSANGIVTITTCDLASFDTTLAAFSGTCAAPTQVACNDDACALQSRIIFSVAVGTPYLIRISAFSAVTVGAGAINIQLDASGGSACLSAPIINEGGHAFFNTALETDITTCAFNDVATAWFEYQATQSGTATVTTCGLAFFDTVLSAWTGCFGSQIVCNDDACGLQSTIAFPVLAGNSYWIRISGYDGASDFGGFHISVATADCVACPPGATVIENEPECGHEDGPENPGRDTVNGGCNSSPPVFTPIVVGDTVCGTTMVVAGTSRDTDWYSFTIAGGTEVTWTVTAEFPILIGFIDSPCPQGAFIPGGVAVAPACTETSVTLCLLPGTYYAFIACSTFANPISCGGPDNRYLAHLTGVPCGPYVPPNDDCATAEILFGGVTAFGDNTNANTTVVLDGASGCTFAGVPANLDVWYRFTPAQNDVYVIETCGSPLDTVLSVWTSCPGNQLVDMIACNDDFCGLQSQVTLPMNAGQTYFIRVAGWNNSAGPFQLLVLADSSGGALNINAPLTFNTDQTINNNVNLYIPGVLGGSGHILVNATFNWYGGVQTGTGSTSVGSGTTLNMFGDGVMRLSRLMTNLVAGNWTGGCLLLDGGQFVNAPGAVFNISGQVETLSTEAGGELFANHGSMFIAPGADATFGSGFALVNTGTLLIESRVWFDADVTLGGIVELAPGGEIDGPGNVTFTGTFIWSGGAMRGTGTTIISAAAELHLGDGNMTLSRAFENHSAAGSWTGGCLLMANGLFNNNVGASLDIFADPQIDVLDAEGENLFNNHGLITVHTGEFVIGVPGENTGTIIVIPPDTLVFTTSRTYLPGSSLQGPGGVTFAAGVHVFPEGTFSITGPVTIFPGVTLVLPASSMPNYDAGTNTFTGGDWVIGDGSNLTLSGADIRTIGENTSFTIIGEAVFEALANLSRIDGTLRLEDGATLAINPDGANGTLINNGHLRVGPGSLLSIDGSYQQTPIASLHIGIAGTTLQLFGRVHATGPAAFAGSMELTYEHAFAPAQGHSFRLVQSAGTAGAFASIDPPAPPSALLRNPVIVDPLGIRHVVTHIADWNNDLHVGVPDIFEFLAAWFAGEPAATTFGGAPGVGAIFAFLAAWFAA